ncbi:glycosyltransferase family 9 protein [Phenylobacterium terrae]|uniref:Glycosyltransferase family 9 protein n=1 Tax=Phenylobacterium terrae TaxID=2665495 RepID=A0ABW4N5J9_9CAUL
MSIAAPPPSELVEQAVTLRSQGRLAEAEMAARAALHLAPGDAGARWALATALLIQGRYAEGLPLLDARHELFGRFKPPLPYPEWTGEPVERLLVWPEQGFGDQIQVARFAAALAERMAVTWICPPPLARLFRASLPVEIVEVAQTIEFPDPDAWVMCFSLPARLGLARPEEAASGPYLRAPDEARARWRGFAGEGCNIGVAWRGNPGHPNDRSRSMPSAEALAPLAAFGRLHDLTEPRGDFADTAALVEQMDLIVSVDTALAHLAGALGKPTRLLLPAQEYDWRWLWGREDSPWYPSMRLYRQPSPGDWASVVGRVAKELG